MFKIKLREMDDIWELMGGSCWGLFPPSFYYTHTEEEIERITKETIECYKKYTIIFERINDNGQRNIRDGNTVSYGKPTKPNNEF